ncbi:MAG: MFS transporter [Bdellovibrionales bacterium]|nr:MFS transporter [Bdellovibrionales bacterium]
MLKSLSRAQMAAIIVAALGYFVDVYDLILFNIVRVASLQSLGYSGDELLTVGTRLLNAQMGGMLMGGILWGIWGDRRGRLSVLFGSILLYSSANILNGFVHSVELYALLRFIAGIGLAGELGAGITLVSEIMPKEKRGLATTVVATVGVAGAIVAALVGDYFSWRISFFIGGGLGLSLLILRVSVNESGLFAKIGHHEHVQKGNLLMLVRTRERFFRFVKSILVGAPTWAFLGILIAFSPEFARAMGVTETVSAGRSVLFFYIGLVLGDFTSGVLSQTLRSRKKVLRVFLITSALTTCLYLLWPHHSAFSLYAAAVPLGFSVGFWAIFVTIAAEQFGTNLRATVATSAPNLVRGSVIGLIPMFRALIPAYGLVYAGLIVCLGCVLVALWAATHIEETFHKDLDFVEV